MATKRLADLTQRNTPAETDIAYIVETVSGDDFKMSLDDISRFANQLSDYADKTYEVDVDTVFTAFTHRAVLILVDTSASAKSITIPTAGNNDHCQIYICAVGTNQINLTINSAITIVAGNACAIYQYNSISWIDVRNAKKLNGVIESESATASTIVKRTSSNAINTVDLSVTGSADIHSADFEAITLNGTPIAAKSITSDIDENLTLPAITNDLELFFTPTDDRVLDATVGSSIEGATLFVSNYNSGDFTVTVLYNSTSYIIPANTFFSLKSNGTVFCPFFQPASSKVGQLYLGIDTTYPDNVLPFNGAIKVRSLYPEIITKILAGDFGTIVTDAAWLAGAAGNFSSGDRSTTFRVPDWQGLFMRFAGTNNVLKKANNSAFSGGGLLSILLDTLQGHRMYRNPDRASETTARSEISAGLIGAVGGAPLYNVTTTGDPVTDGVNGTPRIGAETRPASVSIRVGIIYKN